MKLRTLLEAGALDVFKSQLAQLQNDFIPQYEKWRDSLSLKDVSLLTHMVKSQKEKKGVTKRIDPEHVENFKVLGLLNNHNQLHKEVRPFLRWLAVNPSRGQDWVDKRSDANDALSRGRLKRDNGWTDPKQKRARSIAKSLTDEEKEIFRKVYNRFLRKKTHNLAAMWGNMPAKELVAMQKRGIMDTDGNLTEVGAFVINYYMAFKNDPDGLDRVKRANRVGNYGTAKNRRQDRTRKFTKPRN